MKWHPNVPAAQSTGLSLRSMGQKARSLLPRMQDASSNKWEAHLVSEKQNARRLERGVKRICPSCESRFYDLARESFACPSCGAELSQKNFPEALAITDARPPRETRPAWRSGTRFMHAPQRAAVIAPAVDVTEIKPEDEADETDVSVDDAILDDDDDDDTPVDRPIASDDDDVGNNT